MNGRPAAPLQPEPRASALFTPEGEAALLSEYGVRGPYDALLDVQAASRFRSHYGDANVFLTGQVACNESDEDTSFDIKVDQLSGDQLLHYPIDLLVCHYTPSFTSKAPTSLVQNISEILENFQPQLCPDFKAFSSQERAHHPTQPSSDSVVVPTRGCKPNVEPDSAVTPHLGGDLATLLMAMEEDMEADGTSLHNSFLDEADALLAQADACSRMRTRVDRHADPYLVELRAQLAQEEELLSATSHLDAAGMENGPFTEDESLKVLQQAQSLVEKACAQERAASACSSTAAAKYGKPLTSFTSERGGSDRKGLCDSETVSRASLSSHYTVLPKLYAFEISCTLEQATELQQWGALLSQCEARYSEQGEAFVMSDSDPLVCTDGGSELAGLASVQPPLQEFSARDAPVYQPPPPEAVDNIAFFAKEAGDMRVTDTIATMTAASKEHTMEAAEDKQATQRCTSPSFSEGQIREQEGKVVLHSFVELLDRLLPPTATELALREGALSEQAEIAQTDGRTEAGDAVSGQPLSVAKEHGQRGAHGNGTGTASSLARIQRQAKLGGMVVQHEAMEYRRMRNEDARVEQLMFEEHLLEVKIKESIERCLVASEKGRHDIIEEERRFFMELCRSERDCLNATRMEIVEKQMRELAQLHDEMFARLMVEREQIEHAHEVGLEFLSREKAKELVDVHALLLSRRNEKRDSLIRGATTLNAVSDRDCDPKSAAFFSFFGSETVKNAERLRTEVLLREYHVRVEWLRLHNTQLSSLIARLQMEMDLGKQQLYQGCTVEAAPLDSVPTLSMTASVGCTTSQRPLTPGDLSEELGTSPTSKTPSDQGFSSSFVFLDDNMFRRTQAPLFLAAKEGVAPASRCFFALSFALENIQAIDSKSVRSIGLDSAASSPDRLRSDVAPQVPGVRGDGASVCDLVQDLDLGSNDFEEISLPDVIITFPLLLRLKLSDNRIVALEHGSERGKISSASLFVRSVAAAQQNAISERTRLLELDISSNNLKDIDAVRKYLSHSIMRLCAYANKIVSLEPLRSCLRLTHLELSRNAITSVEPLESLTLLQEINLCYNNITRLDALSKGSWPLLEKLYISNNALTSLMPLQAPPSRTTELTHCLFLSQLFVNYNHITAFSEEEFPWMPMLSVLQAEGNQLRDISGLAHCPRLKSVKMSFNQLESLSSLKPLVVSRLLSTLDISSNPLMASLTQRRVENSDLSPSDTRCEPAYDEISAGALFRKIFPHLSSLNNESQEQQLPIHEDECACFSDADDSDVGRAFAADAFLMRLRAKRESLFVLFRQRFHHATTAERLMREEAKRSAQFKVLPADLLSSTVEHERKLAAFEFLHHSLEGFRESGSVTFDGDYNRLLSHIQEAVPEASSEARRLRESQARDRLSAWLLSLILRRRAERELWKKTVAMEAAEAQRRELAACRIQPIWRGAALRSRMKRILYAGSSELDADESRFTKMDLSAFSGEFVTEAKGLDEIMKQVVARENCTLQHFRLDDFGLQKASPKVLQSNDSVPRSQLNPGAPRQELRSGGGVKLPDLVAPSDASARPSEPGPRWDAAVSAQIEKRREKMRYVHQRHLAEQFMRDPLKVKQQMHQGVVKKQR